MRRLIVILSVLTAINAYSQEEPVNISIEVSDYYIDSTAYTQISFKYTNVTNEPRLIWFEKENINNLSNNELYRNYFKTYKGDFSLTQIIYEEFVNDISDILFLTFYRILEPDQKFRIVLLDEKENQTEEEITKWLEQHLAIVPHHESKGMLPLKDLEKLNYKSEILAMSIEDLFVSPTQSAFYGTHIYSIWYSDYYYLTIKSDSTYRLKMDMYLDMYAEGLYTVNHDTLELTTFSFIENEFKIDEVERNSVKNIWNKYQILDSLLIPIIWKRELPVSKTLKRDTTIITEYLQSDGHVRTEILLHKDSSFFYRSGTGKLDAIAEGSWKYKENRLVLTPTNTDNYLNWICTDSTLVLTDHFAVGKTFNNDENRKEYHYLFKMSKRDEDFIEKARSGDYKLK